MAYSINQVFLVGNVASDVDLKFTQNKQAVANFSIATNRSIKKNDEWESVATFHRIVVWGKLAEQCGASLTKGKRVTIQGRIDNRSYEAKEGGKRYISEVVADSVIYDSPRGSEPQARSADQEPPSAQAEPNPRPPAPGETSTVEDVSDDIPF